jgi:hypothetical protein
VKAVARPPEPRPLATVFPDMLDRLTFAPRGRCRTLGIRGLDLLGGTISETDRRSADALESLLKTVASGDKPAFRELYRACR